MVSWTVPPAPLAVFPTVSVAPLVALPAVSPTPPTTYGVSNVEYGKGGGRWSVRALPAVLVTPEWEGLALGMEFGGLVVRRTSDGLPGCVCHAAQYAFEGGSVRDGIFERGVCTA